MDDYFLKTDDERLVLLWNGKRFENLTRTNEYYHYLLKFYDKFTPYEVNNGKYLLLHFGITNYIVKVYNDMSFYDVYKLFVPEKTIDISTVNLEPISIVNNSMIFHLKKSTVTYDMEINDDRLTIGLKTNLKWWA